MIDEMVRWLIGSIGVGTIAGLVLHALNRWREKREAVVSMWAWFKLTRQDGEEQPYLQIVIRNRSPHDLLVTKIAIVDTPYGHIAFASGSSTRELRISVEPGPPFNSVPPSERLEFPMRIDGMFPKKLIIEVQYWTAGFEGPGSHVARRIEALMS